MLARQLLLLLLLAGASEAGPLDARASTCTVAAAVPSPANFKCAWTGVLAAESCLRQYTHQTEMQCAALCLRNPDCTSFGFASASGHCSLLRTSLTAQGIHRRPKAETTYWNRHCFEWHCGNPSSPSSSPSTSPSSSPSASPSTTATSPPTTTTSPSTKPSTTPSTTPAAATTSPSTTPSTTPASTNTLPTTPPASVFSPPVPTDYSSCLTDPTDAGFTFSFLDDSDGIPFTNNNGLCQKANEVLATIPQYNFAPVASSPGVLDLMLGGQYIAVTTDGDVVFTSQSSGLDYIDCGGGVMCITSLFFYDCSGIISTGILGVVPFVFGTDTTETTGQLYAQPDLSQYNPGAFSKRGLSPSVRQWLAGMRERATLRYTSFVAAPGPTYNIDPNSSSGQRCPATPIGIVPSVAAGARPASSNGCGDSSFEGRLVPNLWFGTCCDNHDLCYDDCTDDWTTCNQNFGDCNRQACQSEFAGDFLSVIEIWGCDQLADFYEWVVGTSKGLDAFDESTTERCSCSCPTNELACNGASCQSVLSDPSNCGACGNVCASGECDNGRCYVSPAPVGAGTNDPCDPTNWYGFEGLDYQYYNGQDPPGVTEQVAPSAQGLASTTALCCQACQSITGCMYWRLAIYNIGDGIEVCYIGVQSGTINNPDTSANATTCPLGGGSMVYFGNGTFDPQNEIEPGPCDPAYCCN